MDKGIEVGFKRRGIRGLLVLAVLLVVSLGCLCGPLSNLPGVGAALSATPTLMSLDGGTDGGTGGDTGGTTGDSGDQPFSFVKPDKSNLKSFRSKFVLTYTGTKEDGTPVDGTFTMEQAHTSDPDASSLHWEGVGSALAQDKEGVTDIIRIGDTTYMVTTVDGAPKCISMSGSSLDSLANPAFSPDSFLVGSDLSHARRILPDEVVNGVLSRHYQFTKNEVSLTDQSWSNYTVDAWAAVDGGYATKSTFVGDGVNVSGAGGKGHAEWTFDLLEINTNITITAPEGCEAPAGGDIPKMSDAADVIAMGPMTNYTTASSLADVVAFYQAQMPGAGWTAGDASTDGPVATLEITKDGQKATITITEAAGKTTVLIQVE
jgi:hypothetical protein